MNPKKKESYIKARGGGKVVVQAKTKEEAIEKAKEKIIKQLEELTPKSPGWMALTRRWKGLLGLEEPVKTKSRKEEFDMKWTNVKGESIEASTKRRGRMKQTRI